MSPAVIGITPDSRQASYPGAVPSVIATLVRAFAPWQVDKAVAADPV